jgi:magnesium transporter
MISIIRHHINNCTVHSDVPAASLSEWLNTPDMVLWLDCQAPTAADLAVLEQVFPFHPLALEDVERLHSRPKIDVFENHYFIVFFASSYDQQTDGVDLDPLYLFVGPNYLVTLHPQTIPEIEQTRARWQVSNGSLQGKVSTILHGLLDAIVDDYFPIIDNFAEKVELLEDQIFTHFDEQAIHSIFKLKRNLLQWRRVLAPQRDVLNVLLRRELSIVRSRDLTYYQDVYEHLVRVTEQVDTYRELLSSALDSYLSVQSHQLNQIVKILTIASIILMANGLIAGIYGMNFTHMPELGWQWGYPGVWLLMLIISGGLAIFFRRIKWW